MTEKKRVLGICGIISPVPYANALCLENVFKELASSGYECHILGTGHIQKEYEQNGIYYHVIKMPTQANSKIKRIYSAIHFTDLPQTEPNVTKIKYRRIKELQEEFGFDYVIGICASYANIYAALQLKRDYPNVKAIGYYLDSIESLSSLTGFARKIRDYYSYRGEERVFAELDGIILPVASSRIYKTSRYEKIRDKIVYAEFPTFIPKEYKKKTNGDQLMIEGIIVGTLNEKYRNPRCLFEAFQYVCEKEKLKLNIDVYGSNDENLFSPIKDSNFITYKLHGRVPHQEIEKALAHADLLINISNSGMLAVPSKIFEYFSSYKPILTQVTDENDSALCYYRKYPESYIYYTYKDNPEQLEGIRNFMRSINGIMVDMEKVNEAFMKNTPTYVSSQIKALLKKYEKGE